MTRSTAHFILLITLGALIIAASVAALVGAPTLVRSSGTSCGCSLTNAPWWLWPSVGAAAAALGWLSFVAVKTWLRTRRFLHETLASRRPFHPSSVGLTSNVSLDLLPGSRAVFCHGFVHPRIAIGEEIVASLNPQQLQAVLSHEAAHAARRDPLRLYVVTVICSLFWRVLGGRSMLETFTANLELDADQAAVERHGQPALAGAFVSLLDRGAVAHPSALPFLSVTESRIRHLLGEEARPSLRWTVCLAVTVGILALVGIRATVRAAAQPSAMTSGQMCARPAVCAVPRHEELRCVVTGAGSWCMTLKGGELFSQRR